MRRHTLVHDLGHVTFVGTGPGASIRGPHGMRGWLVDVGVRVTEEFVSDSVEAKVRIGTATDPDAFAELVIPHGSEVGDVVNTVVDRDAIRGQKLPENDLILVTFVNAVAEDIEEVLDPPAQAETNRSAGAGHVYAVVDWY